jgi:molybdopterin-guanine dinucleotide biosynthesis protein A
MPPVAGAVLAGGRSRRMGRDKAVLPVDGQMMAARVANALRRAGCGPVFAVGGDLVALTAAGVPGIGDRWPGEGPLGAIITALTHTGAPTVVVACDLPWLDEASVAALMPTSSSAAFDVTVATSGRDEPLCACWMPSALPELIQQFDIGERAVHRVFTALAVRRVPVEPAALSNVNTPDDLPPFERSG